MRVTFCRLVPRITAMMMPGEYHDAQHQQKEDADAEALAVHALDAEIEPRAGSLSPRIIIGRATP